MQIQIRVARAIGITIDGQRPAHRFSVGESQKGFDCHDRIGSPKGVMVGPHEVKGIYFDCDLDDFQEGKDPKYIRLETAAGLIVAKVTNVQEDPEDETATLIDAGGDVIQL